MLCISILDISFSFLRFLGSTSLCAQHFEDMPRDPGPTLYCRKTKSTVPYRVHSAKETKEKLPLHSQLLPD
jgi:hypothetical protein